jgi:hypothetical protein
VTGLKERGARDLLGALVADGILASDTPKGPVSLRFPLDAVDMLFPALFSRENALPGQHRSSAPRHSRLIGLLAARSA